MDGLVCLPGQHYSVEKKRAKEARKDLTFARVFEIIVMLSERREAKPSGNQPCV